jgi:hypothetical protein
MSLKKITRIEREAKLSCEQKGMLMSYFKIKFNSFNLYKINP